MTGQLMQLLAKSQRHLCVTIALLGFMSIGMSESKLLAAEHQPTSGRVAMMSPQFNPIIVSGEYVFVANTPNNTIDVIDKRSNQVFRQISVGIEPVGLAIRPDGNELWVANHVSDSVSIVDLQNNSQTFLQVVHTIQDFDPKTKSTRFDEPVGIAFANNQKAYVSLASENQIAVIDVPSRAINKRLQIRAQDPRGLVVQNGRLYVIPFESNNQTQLSGGRKEDIDGNLVTFDAWDHSILNNNVLSIGHVVDIVKNPKVPDRDLFVFDTQNDQPIDTVSTLGTLLYGIAVDSQGRVFIAQTDARNDINGRAGTKKHGLEELDNRPFLNRVTKVHWQDSKPIVSWIDLEPLPPEHPTPETALATPFAIQVSQDDAFLYLTAAGSDAFSILDARSGQQLGRCSVGAVPQGISIEYRDGKPTFAWVLCSAENSVAQIDVQDPKTPKLMQSILLDDPTDAAIKRGRIAFTTAKASSTGTFSCASCHPDGHTDQLLWVLATPIVTGGNQIMPRSTMPVRGLRDTAPFHWDGIPGDPYGGIHSASIRRGVNPNSKSNSPESTTRHLVDGGLASTMARIGDPTKNDEGKAGLLTAQQRDDMAKFLLNIPYPPAQRRAFDNQLSKKASRGFKLFHVDGDLDPSKPKPNVCGDCHRMPHLVSTNTPGTGMDAPTWRGAYDRWLILPQGRLNIIDFDFFQRIIEDGAPERSIWQMSWGGRPRFDPVWEMVLEASTGFPGAFARQITFNRDTASSETTKQLAQALVDAAKQGTIDLRGRGVRLDSQEAWELEVVGDALSETGLRFGTQGKSQSIDLDEIISLSQQGKLVLTMTAYLGAQATVDRPQPELWTSGNIQQQRGRQAFPIARSEDNTLSLSGRYFRNDAWLMVDGKRVPGSVELKDDDEVLIRLETLLAPGMHFLQVQVPHGFISNDFIFYAAEDRAAALALQEKIDEPHSESGAIRRILEEPNKINEPMASGSTPLTQAALWGQLGLVRELLEKGADVKVANRDGNTPLHLAAFMCHQEVVDLLIEHGAQLDRKNNRGETPLDVVQGPWNEDLAEFYRQLGVSLGLPVDTSKLQKSRPKLVSILSQKR
ncbi:MAG: ankyrin repeat domain-containing protein [Planctomycetota bacterium]